MQEKLEKQIVGKSKNFIFTRIGIKQVVPGHAGLAGYPRGYDHNFHALQRGLQLVLTNKTNTFTPVI
jgi:hypothetical protein